MENKETINPNQVETKEPFSDEEVRSILSESQFFNDLSKEAISELIEIIKSHQNKKQEEK